MKHIIFTLAIFAILLSSCRNNSSKTTDTHMHDDGKEHVNHDNKEEKTPQQELFEVEIDSLTTKKDSLNSDQETEHSHDDGHKHKH
ncbi:MAG: hypothetical protein FD155_2709 [Bacteroidetes bacterium]|nr:MAG: hypothetical protein FD155_2709 [Bacteroidota bacterium]